MVKDMKKKRITKAAYEHAKKIIVLYNEQYYEKQLKEKKQK